MRPVDPISELKRHAGAELARSVDGWNGDDMGALLRTDRSRIADLRRGRLDRFSLETLIRFLTRAGFRVALRITRAPPLRRPARGANGMSAGSASAGSVSAGSVSAVSSNAGSASADRADGGSGSTADDWSGAQ